MGRTGYVHADTASLLEGFATQQYTVFDPVTRRFFVSDPGTNRIVVLDAATQKYVGAIIVPGAFGIDETPDRSLLYAGTQVGDVYAINPATLQVVHRYIASEIGPYGYGAFAVRVLADGRLVLLGGQGGIASVDGYSSFGIWSPTTNAISFYASNYGAIQFAFSSIPVNLVCGPLGNIATMTLTGDRTRVLINSIDSDGTLCSVDAATGADAYSSNPGFTAITATPDGKSVIAQAGATGSTEVYVLDAGTLVPLRHFPISSRSSAIVSGDSSTLYLVEGNVLLSYDLSTGAQTGWLPSIYLPDGYGGLVAGGSQLGAFDDTGLIVGPVVEGVSLLDTAAMRQGAPAPGSTNGYVTPATGPIAGGTAIQWSGGTGQELLTATLGGQPMVDASLQSSGEPQGTTPPGPAGPVDLYSLFKDQSALILPRAFSYGPSALKLLPDTTSPDSGGAGILFGYGLGPIGNNAIPADLQITVGGQPATITSFVPNAYGIGSPPFLLQAAIYTIPATQPGGQDVAVSTSSGSTTLKAKLATIPPVSEYPLSGAALAQGVYDPYRDLYYFTDAARIQLFSKTNGAWLPPISISPPPGASSERLWGISLSPDGSKLAVGDVANRVIYLIHPGSGAVQTFAVQQPTASGAIAEPAGLAISDSGVVYYTAAVQGGTGYHSYFKLDTNSGTTTDLGIVGPQNGSDLYLRAVISKDGSRVFFNNDGEPFSIDTVTGAAAYASASPGCCYGDNDISLSSNQINLAATGYEYDTNMNVLSYLVPGIYDSLAAAYVYGEKLSPDGSILFQPAVQGIDVYDGRAGVLLQSLGLPFPLSQNFDALVSDGQDNVLVAITGKLGTGIAVIDLSSIAEPSPQPYLRSGRAAPQFRTAPKRLEQPAAPGNSAARPPALFHRPPHITHDLVHAGAQPATPLSF
jgi:hypothetical protein